MEKKIISRTNYETAGKPICHFANVRQETHFEDKFNSVAEVEVPDLLTFSHSHLSPHFTLALGRQRISLAESGSYVGISGSKSKCEKMRKNENRKSTLNII